MSLSIVFGMPIMEISSLAAAAPFTSFIMPLCVPSPPMIKRHVMPFSTRAARIFSMSLSVFGSNPPLLLPRIVPPRVWMEDTEEGVSCTQGCLSWL